MSANNFLPFCPTDTGSNLLNEADYTAATDRTIGNQPGVASAKLVNKAIRQATYIAGQIAQLLSDKTNTDVLDDATPAKLLAQMNATFNFLNPVVTTHTGAGNHNLTYKFKIAQTTIAPLVGATYTNNGVTYTCTKTVTGLQFDASGNGAPTASGTLVKTAGTGDATLTFYAVRAPLYLVVKAVGGGGGGGGSGTAINTAGGTGGNTTFGTFQASGGGGGGAGSGGSIGSSGVANANTGAPTVDIPGASGYHGGGAGGLTTNNPGPNGAPSFFGGGGAGGIASNGSSSTVYGSGGGGAGGTTFTYPGGSGAAGGYLETTITSPASTYAYSAGVGGTAGTQGTNGFGGAVGTAGFIIVEEHYQ